MVFFHSRRCRCSYEDVFDTRNASSMHTSLIFVRTCGTLTGTVTMVPHRLHQPHNLVPYIYGHSTASSSSTPQSGTASFSSVSQPSESSHDISFEPSLILIRI